MKVIPFLTALTLAIPALAGPEAPVLDPVPMGGSNPDAFSWLKPSVDIRTRYEFREVDGSDASHALTARARAGLLLGEFAGFSAFGEVEATGAAVDDYMSNPAGGLVFKGFLHYFMDDGFNDAYGWEADAVLVKKINDNTTALLKAAYFSADDPGYNDIQQVSVQLDVKF